MNSEEAQHDQERSFAAQAIQVARQSPTSARVGAVIAQGDRVLATGYKDEIKGLHAEQVALRKAADDGLDIRGATIYVTLEPCANSRTSRVPCAQLISEAGLAAVHIGQYDPNPQVNRLGWKYLRDHVIELKDFPADLREEARQANQDFSRVFTEGTGMSGGAKFDFTTNGGRFIISADNDDSSPSWQTRWSNCGASAIYLNAGVPGVVALARYANQFNEIDDPGALDFGNTSARIEIGSIGVMQNSDGYVLCKVKAIEPTADYGGTGNVSVTIQWEVRLASAQPA
ncbi:deaminase [Mycolicibacterium sp. Y3]